MFDAQSLFNQKFQRFSINNSTLMDTKTLKVSEINFSQQSVSLHFTDGRALEDVIKGLLSGIIKPHEIPPIRVVNFRSRWISLDNRRLRVFKNAFISEIQVVVCDLLDQNIKREFEQKKSNKTIEGGGNLNTQVTNSREHFEEGTYVFTQKVLSWSLPQLQEPHPHLKYKTKLPDSFRSRHDYYESFLDLILEEARAILQQGLELVGKGKLPRVEGKITHSKLPKKASNPATLYIEVKRSEISLKSGDMVLLNKGDFSLTGMANYLSPTEAENKICIKIILEEDSRQKYNVIVTEGGQLGIYVLGSVITQMRMYEVCLAKPSVSFENKLITGQIDTNYMSYVYTPNKITSTTSENISPLISTLNNSQQAAIKKFINIEEGIQLIQGPPGTGKTTTIIQLLKLECAKSSRILVSAPSNKAVQILAERFIKECPEFVAIFAGVEDKIPDNSIVEQIFVHTWKKRMQDCAAELLQAISTLQIIFLAEQTKDKEKIVEKQLSILKPQQIIKWKTIALKLSQDFIYLFKQISFYALPFLKEFDQKTQEFLMMLQAYQELMPDSDKIFEPIPEWLDEQRKNISILASTLSWLQMALQNKSDDEVELMLLNQSQIIFATLSVSGRKSFKNMKNIDVLVVDEAGQAVEAETLIPLQCKPKKWLLVGDIKQLPATVISKTAETLNYERSLMQRLQEDCNQPSSLLDIQYRMNPEISIWPSQKYYESKLNDAPVLLLSERELPLLTDAPPFLKPYAFIHIEGEEKTGAQEGHSFSNAAEALAIEKIIKHLDKKYHIEISRQVGVITFYKGQADLLNQKLSREYRGINIQTVDGFQGGESDIIIISFVRANPKGTIGFLKDFRRLNVALTRARHSLIMVGHTDTLCQQNHDISELLEDIKKREKIYHYKDIAQIITPSVPQQKKIISSNPVNKTVYCRFFNGKPDSCQKGDNCKFSHYKNEQPQSQGRRQQETVYPKNQFQNTSRKNGKF